MEIKSFQRPVTSPLPVADSFGGIPELIGITYDLSKLRIKLSFENIDYPIDVLFDGVRGFRVLDEGDLLEFWEPEVRTKGWLWHIEKGGWFDLESLRNGFVSGVTGGYKEFLVLGVNDCISVISQDDPKIHKQS